MVLLFSGCAHQQQTAAKANNDNEKLLNVRCYQTVTNTSNYSICLAYGTNRDAYFIIHLTCPSVQKTELFYDGKRLSGYFVLVGTYSFENDKDGREVTLPAYMARENIQDWYNYDKELLKAFLDGLLSYNYIK